MELLDRARSVLSPYSCEPGFLTGENVLSLLWLKSSILWIGWLSMGIILASNGSGLGYVVTGEIIGCFCTISWDSSKLWKNDMHSVLFSDLYSDQSHANFDLNNKSFCPLIRWWSKKLTIRWSTNLHSPLYTRWSPKRNSIRELTSVHVIFLLLLS